MADTMITIEQIKAPSRRNERQLRTLIGLGLNKMYRRRTLKDSPQVRGMIAKLPHLVRIVDEKA